MPKPSGLSEALIANQEALVVRAKKAEDALAAALARAENAEADNRDLTGKIEGARRERDEARDGELRATERCDRLLRCLKAALDIPTTEDF